MSVQVSEFNSNPSKYLALVETQDVMIVRNGRVFAKLVKEENDTLSDIRSLYGILADSELSRMNDEEIKAVIHTERGSRLL